MANDKPHVEPCGCWAWCETCKGTGQVEEVKTISPHFQIAEIGECPDCKGSPATLKHCAKHARDMGFDVDWRRAK